MIDGNHKHRGEDSSPLKNTIENGMIANKNKLKRLAGLPVIAEKKWSGGIETKRTPPEGLFTKKAEDIVTWLKQTHAKYRSAMSALNFYINRAGSDAPNKPELERAKKLLRDAYGIKEDLDALRRLAGIPVTRVEDFDEMPVEEIEDDGGSGEEAERAEDEKKLEELVSAIAEKAREMKFSDFKKLLCKLYWAGHDDAVAMSATSETAKEEMVRTTGRILEARLANKVAVTPSSLAARRLTSYVGVNKEDDAGWLAVELAKAKIPVDMEEALGIFYFNFKNESEERRARDIAKKLEVELVD